MEQLVLCLKQHAKTMGLHAISLKKSETTHCKVGQHNRDQLTCHRYIISQFAYHNFSTAGGIIIWLCLLCLLLIRKIAVGKTDAVTFQYRRKSILSCWCQPAPLAILLQIQKQIQVQIQVPIQRQVQQQIQTQMQVQL